jgi:hypothetical protein
LDTARVTDPLNTAWQIHAAQMDWTGKVDAKAGFVLAINSAAIATAVALSADGLVFHQVGDTSVWWLYGASIVLFGLAALVAVWAVAPSLRVGRLECEARNDFIYFGHARHWNPTELAEALKDREALPVVTRQIVRMADIAWLKHRKVAWSVWLTVLGLLSMAAAGFALS